MLIGIMSDTHDNLVPTKKAIEVFNDRKVQYVIHAGDYTSPFTLKLFKELNCKYVGIFGNNDGDKLLLLARSEGNIHYQPYIFTLNDRKIVVMHEHHIVNALADSGHFDLVIYGHTHKPDIRKVNNALIVNPGEVGTWLYGKSTIAVADLDSMKAEIIEL
ncbi:MAG: YfcE family phosphodiesterase [Nitrospirae bacterium RBG_13_39_12]|nr:MAG: YfcE family phosphodiesterase [Nitrospirae bacterium RBG_13_39_12]